MRICATLNFAVGACQTECMIHCFLKLKVIFELLCFVKIS